MRLDSLSQIEIEFYDGKIKVSILKMSETLVTERDQVSQGLNNSQSSSPIFRC